MLEVVFLSLFGWDREALVCGEGGVLKFLDRKGSQRTLVSLLFITLKKKTLFTVPVIEEQ